MKARGIVLLLAAIAMAGTAGLFARIWLTSERAQVQPQVAAPVAPATSVLVAKADLPTGLFLKEEHLRWQAWPSETLDPGYLVEGKHDLAALVGAVVRSSIAAGQPITEGRVVRPGDRGFRAAVHRYLRPYFSRRSRRSRPHAVAADRRDRVALRPSGQRDRARKRADPRHRPKSERPDRERRSRSGPDGHHRSDPEAGRSRSGGRRARPSVLEPAQPWPGRVRCFGSRADGR